MRHAPFPVLAVSFLLISSCTATRQGIFFVDPHYEAAFGREHRGELNAAAQAAGVSLSFSVLPLEGSLQAAFRMIDSRKPDFIGLSPLLALEAAKIDAQYPVLSVLVPGCLLDLPPTQIYASKSDHTASFKAVGRIMASYIAAYSAANADLPFAAAVFSESLPDNVLYQEAFLSGYAEILAESPPLAKLVPPTADPASLETLAQELFVMNTKIVLYAAGPADPALVAKTPKSGVLVISEGMAGVEPAHQGLVLSIEDDGKALANAVFDSWIKGTQGLVKVPSLLVPIGSAAEAAAGEKRLIEIIREFSPLSAENGASAGTKTQ